MFSSEISPIPLRTETNYSSIIKVALLESKAEGERCVCYMLKTDLESHDFSLFTGVPLIGEKEGREWGADRAFHCKSKKGIKMQSPGNVSAVVITSSLSSNANIWSFLFEFGEHLKEDLLLGEKEEQPQGDLQTLSPQLLLSSSLCRSPVPVNFLPILWGSSE